MNTTVSMLKQLGGAGASRAVTTRAAESRRALVTFRASVHNYRGQMRGGEAPPAVVKEGELLRFVAVLAVLANVISIAPSWANGLRDARAALQAEERRDFAAAVALYTKAIDSRELSKTQLRDAYHYRGNARFFLEQYGAAADDYVKSLQIDPTHVYAALWLYFANARAGRDAARTLAGQVAKLDLFFWPGPVVSLLLGRATVEQVVQAAKDPFLSRGAQRSQECEAYFYIGQFELLHRRRDAARRWFRMALDTGAATYVEFQAARRELERMQAE
jgi:lipoprotein NlpI